MVSVELMPSDMLPFLALRDKRRWLEASVEYVANYEDTQTRVQDGRISLFAYQSIGDRQCVAQPTSTKVSAECEVGGQCVVDY